MKKINPATLKLLNKGYSVKEFLKKIKRNRDWYYKHSNGGKDYDFMMLAIDGLQDKFKYKV